MPPKQNRATATDNVNKDLVKDRMCSFGDLLEDRQTDRQTNSDGHAYHNTPFLYSMRRSNK